MRGLAETSLSLSGVMDVIFRPSIGLTNLTSFCMPPFWWPTGHVLCSSLAPYLSEILWQGPRVLKAMVRQTLNASEPVISCASGLEYLCTVAPGCPRCNHVEHIYCSVFGLYDVPCYLFLCFLFAWKSTE